MEFMLNIKVETLAGETEDEVYRWLCNKLFELEGVTDDTEVLPQTNNGDN